MTQFFHNSLFFGVAISFLAYEIGLIIKKKWKLAIYNPLLISIIVVMIILKFTNISYETYNFGAVYISYLLTPATICLAIPLYQQLHILKKNVVAIITGILSGVLSSMGTVLGLSVLFGLTHKEYVTLLPKSITTAIGMVVSEELGGEVTITVAIIVITGVLGNIIAEPVCKIFRITDPIAKGIGIGSASHAIGTTKAMEMGEIEGAMSGLSIAVSGIITVIMASFFAMLY